MPKAAVLQTGFNTGEVSPLCYGVADNPRYKKGLEILLNYIPTLQGPIVRRPGTRYLTNVKDSANPPILVPFKFSAAQNYMFEFGDKYIRFYAANGQVIWSAAGFQISGTAANGFLPNSLLPFYATRATLNPQGNETVNLFPVPTAAGDILELQSPYAIADVSLLRWAQTGNNLYIFHPNYPVYKLQREGQNFWKLSQVYFLDGPYAAANSYLSVGDNVGTQLAALNTGTYPNSNQIMAVGVANIAGIANVGGSIGVTTTGPHGLKNGRLIFIANVTGTTEANNFSNFFGRTSTTPQAYWSILVTSPTTFTLVGSTYTNAYGSGGTIYSALFAISAQQVQQFGPPVQDIGRAIALQVNGVRYWGNISTVFDAATIAATMGGTATSGPVIIPTTTTAGLWNLGTYSIGNGFPATGVFHQDRLWLAGAAQFPQNVDSSNAGGLYETFSPSVSSGSNALQVTDANSCSFTLNSEDKNPIRWMEGTAQGLLAGTYANEWAMTPSGNSEALTPTNFNAQQTSFFGSAAIAPGKIGNAVLYVQRAARKLREMAYFFYAGTFRSSDLTEISEHITNPSLIQVAIQKESQPLAWSVRSDGVLTSMVYNRDDVSLSAGWARHILGGQSAGGANPVVLSVGFIPDPLVTFDQMWLVVKRFINGATVCTVEYMTNISNDLIAQADSVQCDCSGVYSGSPTNVITGLTWLIGETVSVLGDGANLGTFVVDGSGHVTLPVGVTVSKAQVGYAYTSQGKLLRAEAGGADGTSFGKTRRTVRAAFQLHRVGSFAFSTDFTALIPVDFSKMDQSLPFTVGTLYSGMIRDGVESRYDFESQICFQQNDLLPGTVQSVTSFMEEFDI